MCTINVLEQGQLVGIKEGRIYCSKNNEILNEIPVETVDSINVYGNSQITTQCIVECLKRSIPIIYSTSSGAYRGCTICDDGSNAGRLKKQVNFVETDEAIILSKDIITNKINNQVTILRRYQRRSSSDITRHIRMMLRIKNKIGLATNCNQIMGCEGIAARYYFSAINEIIKADYRFLCRTPRVSKDYTNSLLNFGYTLLYKEIIGMIKSKKLDPYIGFTHKDKNGHAALASDIMEEWRPIIVDSLVLGMINGNEINDEDFEKKEDGNCFLNSNGVKKFVRKYNNKMNTCTSYISSTYKLTYRMALHHQIESFTRVIEDQSANAFIHLKCR